MKDVIKHTDTDYQEIFDKASDAIFIMDINSGEVISANKSSSEMLGYTTAELKKLHPKDISSLNSGYTKKEADSKIEYAATKGPVMFEWECRRKNGELFWVDVTLIKAKISNNDCILAFFHEIDERKKAELALKKSEANLRSIFSHTEVGFILLDEKFKILASNNVADEWAKLSFEASLEEGVNLISLVREDRKDHATHLIQQVLTGKSFDEEVSYPYLDGSQVWYKVKMSPVFDNPGSIIGVCISAIDISKQKISELEKQKITNDLVQRNKVLEQFAYIVSHNLRGPVANIMGISNILENYISTKEERPEIEGYLFKAVKQLDDVIHDINNILHTKLANSDKKETVYFHKLTENIKSSLQNIIEKEKVQIITDFTSSPCINTLKGYMYSIFHNLILNSIKYSQPNKTALIRIKTESEGDLLRIRFKDNGLGIDLDRHGEKIFGLYNRFHSSLIEGKGIGLFMVKTQVEAMGGKIEVKSKPNIGTEFIIEFIKP